MQKDQACPCTASEGSRVLRMTARRDRKDRASRFMDRDQVTRELMFLLAFQSDRDA